MSKRKVAMYGSDRVMALSTDNKSIDLYSIDDVHKVLADKKLIELKETKQINADWLDKFEQLWQQHGKVEMEI